MLNNFIYAKSKSLFTRNLEAGKILDDAIVFIEDSKEIWTHGNYFDCSNPDFQEVLKDYVSKTTAQNYVDKSSNQTIEGLKTFTNNININNLIRIRTNIYPGELKVTRADNDKGFMIRVNKDSTDDILPLEIVTTNGTNGSYQYNFPKSSGNVALGIKINNDQIYRADLSSGLIDLDTSYIKTTYTNLKSLRDSNKLIAGQLYRITDFITTTNGNEYSSSANHKFDVIVQAASSNTLSENAKVCHSETLNTNNSTQETPINNASISPSGWASTAINNVPEGIKNIINFTPSNSTDIRNALYTRNLKTGILEVTFSWVSGSKKINCLGVEIIKNSVVIALDFHEGYSGNSNSNNKYTLYIPKSDSYVIKLYINARAEGLDSTCKINAISKVDYFESCKLNAWEIKYTLDNDTSRFNWAKSDGKGVIYYMKDEYCNEADYDFKNILFSGKYTFSYTINNTLYDGSVKYGIKCHHNKIGVDLLSYAFKGLPQIYFNNTSDSSECNNNRVANNCWKIFFGNNCYWNNIGEGSESLTFGNNCIGNTFGNECKNMSFGNYCSSNKFGNYCTNNKFTTSSSGGTNLNYCRNIEIDDYCNSVNLYCTSTTNNSSQLQNIKVTQNVTGNVQITQLNLKRVLIIDRDVSNNITLYFLSDINNKQDTLVSGTNIKTINGESLLGSEDIVISGGVYNTELEDDLKMNTNVGGIAANTTVLNLKGKTYTELFDAILFPDQNPTYTDASVTGFTLSSSTSPVEIGTSMVTVTETGSLNQGFWNLYNLQQDGSKLPYVGLETSRKYEFSVNGNSYTSTSGVPSITDTTFNKPGSNTFKLTIYYGAGRAPKNNKGVEVPSIAASSGSKSSSYSINVTYPFWVLLKGNTEATKKVLACSIGTTTGTISFNKIGTLPAVNNNSGDDPVLFKVKGLLTTLKKVNTLNANAPIDILGDLKSEIVDGYTVYRYKDGTAIGEQEINNGTITFNL